MKVSNAFDAYLADVEYTFDVPTEYDRPDEDRIRIGMSAVGGGTIGKAYANNRWIWGVWVNDTLILSAADLHSNAVAATHAEMVRTLCTFLSADGDTIACGGSPENESYTSEQRKFLGYHNERLWTCSTAAYEAGEDTLTDWMP